jgi:septum formation protein
MLYLASRSPRRRQLLRRHGYAFRTVPSAFRESIRPGERPERAAMRNAAGKARAARLPGRAGLVLGCDTLLWFQGRIIGKPRSMGHARRLLRELSGRTHRVYTGLCLRDAATGRTRTAFASSRVTFKRPDAAQLARLMARSRPLDKAGAYAVQEDRGTLIARIEGSRTNVIGLPMELLRRELRRWRRSAAHAS